MPEQLTATPIPAPTQLDEPSHTQMGFFGNVWMRLNRIPLAGQFIQGHTHNHDHMSLLVRGRVRIVVDGYEPTEFSAPAIIPIKAEHSHQFIALEDDAQWFCVFALRNLDGSLADEFTGVVTPYGRRLPEGVAIEQAATDGATRDGLTLAYPPEQTGTVALDPAV